MTPMSEKENEEILQEQTAESETETPEESVEQDEPQEAPADGSEGMEQMLDDVEGSDELEAERERYYRLLAEYKNFQKRTAKEKLEAYGDATARCIGELLPVIDNFERAVDAPCSDENYHSGVVMILNQLRIFLEKQGVTEVQALGAEFDPNIHNAIKQAEATEEYPENTVCEVFQKGYLYKEKLIRPAMVAVAG